MKKSTENHSDELVELRYDDGRVDKVTREEYDKRQKQLQIQKAHQQENQREEDEKQKFAAIEHVGIGNKAFHEFLLKHWKLMSPLQAEQGPSFNANTLEFLVNHRLRLTPGLLVALGGDFFGKPKEPICEGLGDTERQQLFLIAYDSLADVTDEKVLAEIHELRRIIQGEGDAILKGLEKGIKPNEALEAYSGIKLHKLSAGSNYAYGMASRHIDLPWMFFYSRYVDLAAMNFDHFGEDAKLAFFAGYETALKTARTAGWIKIEDNDSEAIRDAKQKQRYEQLAEAFQQALFACHFLTDLFASGHLRTPRRALVQYLHGLKDDEKLEAGKVAGFLAKAMHDEDNIQGLWVESDAHPWSEDESSNQAWQAFGDHCYFSPENELNQARVIEAVEAVLEGVYEAFQHPSQSPTIDIARYIPRVIDPSKVAKIEVENGERVERRNHQPLFTLEVQADEKRIVTRRKSLKELNDTRPRKTNWHSLTTLGKLNTFWSTPQKEFKPLEPKEQDELRTFLSVTEDETTREETGSRCLVM